MLHFKLKFAKNRLLAWLRQDPLGELTALPQTPSLNYEEGGREEVKGMRKLRGGRGREGQGVGCIVRQYKSWPM